MPPYLSPAWVQSFNAALAGLDLTDAITAAGAGSLTASRGTFGVAQVVTDAPPGPDTAGGTLRTVLTVDDGRITLVADPVEALPANVTMVLAYADALAIARGELEPAEALAGGRVRVRGELAVLVAGQAILQAASAALGQSLADLTDLDDTVDTVDTTELAGPADPGQ
jgi:SCP-2 sterol transfer family